MALLLALTSLVCYALTAALIGVRSTSCIVLYRKFLEWPKYKLQGPLEKENELTNS